MDIKEILIVAIDDDGKLHYQPQAGYNVEEALNLVYEDMTDGKILELSRVRIS